MNISVRKATFNDIDNGLFSAFIEGYRHHQNGRPDRFKDLSNDVLKKELIDNFDSISIIVALNDEKVVGYLKYNVAEKSVRKLFIEQFAIIKDFRGKEIGKILMQEVKNIAIKNNCDRIELDCWTFNKDAISMYEHMGFTKQRIRFEFPLKDN